MIKPQICIVIERMPNEDYISAFKRAVLGRFDSEVKIIKHIKINNEIYLVLNKLIDGKPKNFIMIATIHSKLINKVRSWEVKAYFEKDQPEYFNCPKSYFILCPTKNIDALTWRNKIDEIRLKRVNSAKENRHIYKIAESFEVGDVLIHPKYGQLHIQHINQKERAMWCLNEKHSGVRKYKLPLMSLEDWKKNIDLKNSL